MPEAITGDIPYWLIEKNQRLREKKIKNEKEAMSKIKKMMPKKIGQELYDLWSEYKTRKTLEAKIAKMLDGQEVKIQHFEEGVKHWHPKEQGLWTIDCGDKHLDFSEAEKIRPLIELIRQELINQHKKNKIKIQ